MYLYLKCSVKGGDPKYKILIYKPTKMTHVMCSPWQMTFTLVPLAHLTMFSPWGPP
jgi:hypothetical protein